LHNSNYPTLDWGPQAACKNQEKAMDISQGKPGNRNAILEKLRQYDEDREKREVHRQRVAERENRLRLWLLTLRLLVEVPTQSWTEDDHTMAQIAFRSLQKARLPQCDAREERDRVFTIYEDVLRKTGRNQTSLGDEDEEMSEVEE
jgi:hypothetical protein